MPEPKISKSLRKKIADAFDNTGVVYWNPAHYGSVFDLRTVTNVYENGKERSKSLVKLQLKDQLELIAAIQKAYPKIIGFEECLQSAWYGGNLPPSGITLGEIREMAGTTK
ncbi:MAG: hypothetical protein IPL32_17930 [Chloracidobacterium sp.]|nr:hypothetical protein [Chloracidobacterium sp.]